MNVLVTGRISVYPMGGNYQIYIEKMEMDGLGNLYIEFEKLKKKLASEGLFDSKYKKPIPKYPTKIGIITAPTGAAIKDILRRGMEYGYYQGVNLALSYCDDCGHQELDMHVCPKCGSDNLTKIDRMNGYLSYSKVKGDSRLNDAKMDEIADRK